MAQGDLVWFNEAKALMVDGGYEAADDIKCALITTVPSAGQTTPTLSDFTECTPGGQYTAGGISLGNLGTCVNQTAGTAMFDSTTNPSWAQDASNPTNATAALVYHVTSGQAFCYVDLGGAFNMTSGALSITWHGSGLATW